MPACLLFSAALPGSKRGRAVALNGKQVAILVAVAEWSEHSSAPDCRSLAASSSTSSAPSGGAPSLPPSLPLSAVTVSLQSPHTRAPRLQTRPPHTVGRGGGGPSKIALPACWASAEPAAPARICSCCSAAAESRGLQRRANWLVNRRIALAPSQQKTDGRWTEEGAVVVHFRAFKPQARF